MIGKKPSNYGDILIQIINTYYIFYQVSKDFEKYILSHRTLLSSDMTMQEIYYVYREEVEKHIHIEDEEMHERWWGFSGEVDRIGDISTKYPHLTLDDVYHMICVVPFQELSQSELIRLYDNCPEPLWITNQEWLFTNEKYVDFIVDKYFKTNETDWIYTMTAIDFSCLLINTIHNILIDTSSNILQIIQKQTLGNGYSGYLQVNHPSGLDVKINYYGDTTLMDYKESSICMVVERWSNNRWDEFAFMNIDFTASHIHWCQHNYRELIKSIVGCLLQTLDEYNLLDKEALDELLQQQRRENMNEKELMLELNNNIMKLINVMANK